MTQIDWTERHPLPASENEAAEIGDVMEAADTTVDPAPPTPEPTPEPEEPPHPADAPQPAVIEYAPPPDVSAFNAAIDRMIDRCRSGHSLGLDELQELKRLAGG